MTVCLRGLGIGILILLALLVTTEFLGYSFLELLGYKTNFKELSNYIIFPTVGALILIILVLINFLFKEGSCGCPTRFGFISLIREERRNPISTDQTPLL